ncbi:MAG: molybdopterin-dependent oxidoreductase [Thermoanaerobaculia bacterium]|nr:molybdopterin-dependent oxidoreductase [Thermoanaerobaculia bacterium]
MKLEVSRRDLLLAGTGAAAGIVLSPVPWKALDDLSIWTQRPPTPTPRPAGPLAFRFTSCSLCPAACGLKARSFGPQPVGFSGVPGHPASDGGLCPLGLTGHHLAKHPLRAVAPERVSGGKREVLDRAAASAALSAAIAAAAKDPKRSLLVVDGRPGRSLSRTWRALAAATGGRYAVPASPSPALDALASRFDGPLALGVDYAKARRVVSFGAPVLTDAGTPGLLARLRAEKRRLPLAERLEVVHVGATRTKSAGLADRFVPIAPGTEAALALGLVHVLLDEKLADAAFLAARTTGLAELEALAARFAPPLVEQKTGVPAGDVVALARDLAQARPSVVVGGDPATPVSAEADAAIAALNLVLGAPAGPLVARRAAPAEPDGDARLAGVTALAEVPEGSVGLLLLDGTVPEGLVPWERLEKLLAAGAVVASFSPFRAGLGEKATLLVPGPAPLEEAVELDGPADAPLATFALAPALLAPPKGVVLTEELLREAATAAGLELPAPSAGRAAAIVAAKRGQLFDPSTAATSPVSSLADAAALEAAFANGACWVDDPAPSPAGRFALLRDGEAPRLLEAALGAPGPEPVRIAGLPRTALAAAPTSPLLTKLTRETALFPAPSAAKA